MTLTFTAFTTVYGDDGLLIFDASANDAPLAVFTGSLPVPMSVTFATSSLRVSLRVQPGNRQLGFNATYDTTGACAPLGCTSGGACVSGQCVCPPGLAGADCSLALQPIVVPDISGTSVNVSGTTAPGAVTLFEITVPPPDANATLVLDMTWQGDDDAKPPAPMLLLLQAPATQSGGDAAPLVYISNDDGTCPDASSGGCHWALPPADAAAPSDSSAITLQQGPTAMFALHGALVTTPTHGFGVHAMRLPALPTPTVFTYRDTPSWASRSPRHMLTVPLPALADPGMTWRVGVANTLPTVMPSFLAADATGSWGQGPGYLGAAGGMHFTLRVAGVTNATGGGAASQAVCPGECSGRGTCLDGACVCASAAGRTAAASDTSDPPSATNTSSEASDMSSDAGPQVAAWADADCSSSVTFLTPNGTAVSVNILPNGQMSYFYLPLDASLFVNAALVVEAAFDGMPSADLILLVSRASSGPPSLAPPVCRVWRHGEGPWLEDDCGAGGKPDFLADFIAGDAPSFAGESYRTVYVPPETHVLPDAQPLGGRGGGGGGGGATTFEAGYFVAIYAPSASWVATAASVPVQLRAEFHYVASFDVSDPACPFDCSGNAKACVPPPDWTARGSASGASVALAGTCVCAGSIIGNDTSAAAALPSSSDTAAADAHAGLYCQYDAPALAVNSTYTGAVAYGGWAYWAVDLPGPGAAIVSVQTEAPSDTALPSPVLLFKQGSPPKAAAVLYSDAIEFATVNAIGPATNQSGASSTDTAAPPSSTDAQAGAAATSADAFSAPVGAPAPATAPSASSSSSTQIAATSCGPLGTPGNAILALRGVVPRAAQVVQLSFASLALFARDAAAARGACVALITSADGILDAACPAVRGGGLHSAEEASSSSMWGATDPLLPDTAFPPTSLPGPSSPQLLWARTLRGTVTLQGELLGRGGAYLEFFQMDPASEAASLAAIASAGTAAVAAHWQGAIRVGYTRPIDTGFDATDMRAVLCAGVDCGAETALFGGFQLVRPSRVFIGMYRPHLAPGTAAAARAATVQALRADPVTGVRAAPPPPPAPLGYTLSLTYIPADNASSPAAVPCFGDCAPNGQCLAVKAPQCTCSPGFFGPTCAIQPTALVLTLPPASDSSNKQTAAPTGAPTPAPSNVAEASGIVQPGRFTYFSIRMTDASGTASTALPGSLLVTLSYPGGTGAHGHLYARAGKLPVACHITDGGSGAFNPGAVRCRDAYDAVDLLVPPLASSPAPAAAPAVAPAPGVAPSPPSPRTIQHILILTPTGGGTTRTGLLHRAGTGMRLGYGRGGVFLAIGNPASSLAPLNFSLLALAVPGELCPGGDGSCGGHGACDTSRGVCTCDAGWAGPACDSPVYAVTPTPRSGMPGSGADTASATSETDGASGGLLFDAPILPGRAAFITFSINCTDQALNFTVVPTLTTSPDGEGDASSSSSSSDVTSDSTDALPGSDSSMRPPYVLALRRGGLPSVGAHVYDQLAQPRPSDGAVTLFLPAAKPGVYTAELYVSPRAQASVGGFMLAAAVTPSSVPNPWNGCTQPDGALAVSLTPTDPATSALDPAASVTLNSSSAEASTGGDVAQLALGPGACVAASCDIATAVATAGGRLNGTAVLALAAPSAPNAAAYFYQAGDPRKHVVPGGGSLSPSNASMSSDGSLPIGTGAPQGAVLYVTLGGNTAATDLEACNPLTNADAVRAGGICVAVRGGCTFATKVAACQAAGAAFAVIINNDASAVDVGASMAWVISGPSAANLTIPAVALSFAAGQQLLGFMLDPSAVPGSVAEAGASQKWSSPYTRRVGVNISASSCQPTAMCVACAPGLASPLDGCMSAACPGMDARYTRNCSGHGMCSLTMPGGSFGPAAGSCACADGWGGPSCGASTMPPWFISRPADVVAVVPGQTVRLVMRAVDATFGSITYSLPVAPPGATLNPTTGLFLYDTSPLVGSNTSGPVNTSMAVQVAATGGNGLSASASFTVLVTDAPPDGVAPAPMQAAVSSDAPSPAPVPDAPLAPTPAPAPSPGGDTQAKGVGITSSSEAGMTPSGGGSRRKHKGLDGGAVAGIVIAVLAATGLAGLAAFTYSKHRHSWVGPVGRMRQARLERHTQLVEF